jgi:hypothetical protein
MKRRYRPAEKTVAKLRKLAAEGCTYKEAAERLRLTVGAVGQHARAYDIPLIRGTQGPHTKRASTATPRTEQMAALYKSGQTLAQIGKQFNITRERVRQLIRACHGLRADSGGQHEAARVKRAKFEAKRNDRSLAVWGCNFDQYQIIRDLKKPTRAFNQQRGNAHRRGIGWDLTLWQWWSIWQQSGHWAERGRGQGYVMCRKGDNGPYSLGNVFIATARENCSERPQKKSGLPMGVRKNKLFKGYTALRCINGKRLHLGSHPTPELAYAAYLSAEVTS